MDFRSVSRVSIAEPLAFQGYKSSVSMTICIKAALPAMSCVLCSREIRIVSQHAIRMPLNMLHLCKSFLILQVVPRFADDSVDRLESDIKEVVRSMRCMTFYLVDEVSLFD